MDSLKKSRGLLSLTKNGLLRSRIQKRSMLPRVPGRTEFNIIRQIVVEPNNHIPSTSNNIIRECNLLTMPKTQFPQSDDINPPISRARIAVVNPLAIVISLLDKDSEEVEVSEVVIAQEQQEQPIYISDSEEEVQILDV